MINMVKGYDMSWKLVDSMSDLGDFGEKNKDKGKTTMKELKSLVLLINKQNKYAFRESSERGQIVDRQQREGRRNRAHPCIRTHFVPFLSTFTLSGETSVFLKRTCNLLWGGGGCFSFSSLAKKKTCQP